MHVRLSAIAAIPFVGQSPFAPLFLSSALCIAQQAFGIVMWEITSYGAMPYQDLKTQEVQRKVREGARLEPVPGTNEDYFAIAKSCWRVDRDARPKFSVRQEGKYACETAKYKFSGV
eukprot:TRINITY_DN7660_c0_g1_i2.p4 TRINITY_DN7660_c0_g1~~TRINITY_DN7660_c0_g1_i2.p4  ORF type:complete len:117 (+),score=13.13 TRINITY_DN7660_c0_g1_i2:2323-2673(+)